MRGLFQKEASLLEFLGLGRKKVIMAGPWSAGKREVRLLAEYARKVGTERERENPLDASWAAGGF